MTTKPMSQAEKNYIRWAKKEDIEKSHTVSIKSAFIDGWNERHGMLLDKGKVSDILTNQFDCTPHTAMLVANVILDTCEVS